ncbi:MAG: M55 family metallopeptidase [Firmicutes bacterium]|nr:M55 family metallopeptidase [Bacillota bacterium]
MRVYISADIEGVCGVVHNEQTGGTGQAYERARKLMAGEVNAAIEGALEAGADYIVVNDSHWLMRNLLPEDLRTEALLITGSPKPLSMLEGLDSSFDAAIFTGYHAAAGEAGGILNHTYSGVVRKVVINGMVMGETGINAAVCGYFGVPVVMVSGDSTVAAEASRIIPWAKGVAVKKSIVRTAALESHPAKVREMIKAGAREGLLKRAECRPLIIQQPVRLEMEFQTATMADMVELVPSVQRTGAFRIAYEGKDFLEIFKLMRVFLMVAGTVRE